MSDLTAPHQIDTDSLSGEVAPVRRAVLGLGGNLGDRLETLQAAVYSLSETPGVAVVAVSPVYETTPVGSPPGTPDFLNAVAIVDTALSPGVLLERSLALEDAFGRERVERWGPRTLDIDVLVVGDVVVDEGEDLQVPHPRIAERGFVLVPWADVAPETVVPGLGSVAELLAAVQVDGRVEGVRRYKGQLTAPG